MVVSFSCSGAAQAATDMSVAVAVSETSIVRVFIGPPVSNCCGSAGCAARSLVGPVVAEATPGWPPRVRPVNTRSSSRTGPDGRIGHVPDSKLGASVHVREHDGT
ncbi:hypothetical protein GCM10009641_78700 [Mycobacterium cookii]|uniref:Secreted protein n=1 Tax=Nocardioides furvisabuli TaxID=375542 RepID=A0ABP5J4V4_9ACTN